jgi:hypothetical protein
LYSTNLLAADDRSVTNFREYQLYNRIRQSDTDCFFPAYGEFVMSKLLPKYIGLSFISASVLALQVTFTRIFSIMIWYHFAYLIIGVALLGGGAAGTYLAIRQWDAATISRRIGKLAVGFSLSILLSLLLISVVHFDPLGGKTALLPTLIGLAIYFTSLFSAFFLGGLTVASAFSLWAKRAHRLYFADLLGASVGTLIVIWLIQSFTGPGALAFIALLALVAGFLFGVELPQRWKWAMPIAALGELGLFLFISFVSPVQLPIPESKELGVFLPYSGVSQPEYTRWNPVARVDVVPSVDYDVPWIVGGISSVYFGEKQQNQEGNQSVKYRQQIVTFDGTSATAMHQFDGEISRFDYLDYAIISAPYQVGVERPTVLNIGVGGGLDIILARLHDSARITAIDLNSDAVALLKGPYADFTGRLADDPRTTIMTAEGRSFLMRSPEQYDIIQGIGLDNFAALSGGAYVLAESYLYTVDAFEQSLSRLTPDGIFSWTRTLYSPPREMLRLTGLAAEALRRQDVTDPAQHIAIVANEDGRYATLLVSRAPFTPPVVERLHKWAKANNFNLLHDPFERLDTVYADYLYAPDPRAFEAAYSFNIHPVTDDNPFFYNYFKWSGLLAGSGVSGGDVNLRFPIGNLVLLTILGLSAITAVAFIGFPLWRYRRDGLQAPHSIPMLIYFSALGLGYIFMEIVLIQRFTLFIGYPTLAITTTVFSMLFFSALGSLAGRRVCKAQRHLQILLVALVGMIFVYLLGLLPLLLSLLQLPDPVRVLISFVIIAPLAFVMGMPFPTGLKQLSTRASILIPWAWGMNGVFSVLGSVLVILISMQVSFTFAMASAALFYGVAAVTSASLWKVGVVEDRLEYVSSKRAIASTLTQPD